MANRRDAYFPSVKVGGSKVRVSSPTPKYVIPKDMGESGQYVASKDYQMKVWKSVGPETREPKTYQRSIYGNKKKAQGR